MIEEHMNLPAGDDPPVAEADFTLTFPVVEYGYEYVGLKYVYDGCESDAIAILLTPHEFKRLTKMMLRFDEKLGGDGVVFMGGGGSHPPED
jgi:hypothetical protein